MILTVTLNPCVDHLIFLNGPLLPHDTNPSARIETDTGGKGINVARVLAELSDSVMATGFIGGETGNHIRQTLSKQGVSFDFVETAAPTRQNFGVEDLSGRPPTTFNARGGPITGLEWENILAKVDELSVNAEWVVLGGSLPQGCPDNAFHILGEVIHRRHARVVLDADGKAKIHGMNCQPDFIKPNVSEASRYLGRKIETEPEVIAASHDLYQQLVEDRSVSPIVIISRGADGAVMTGEFGTLIGEPVPVEVTSTVGSGDSMIAGVLHGLVRNLTIEESLRWGLAAGAATAMTDGTEIGRRVNIESCFERAVVRWA